MPLLTLDDVAPVARGAVHCTQVIKAHGHMARQGSQRVLLLPAGGPMMLVCAVQLCASRVQLRRFLGCLQLAGCSLLLPRPAAWLPDIQEGSGTTSALAPPLTARALRSLAL